MSRTSAFSLKRFARKPTPPAAGVPVLVAEAPAAPAEAVASGHPESLPDSREVGAEAVPDAPDEEIPLWIIQDGLYTYLQSSLDRMDAQGIARAVLLRPEFMDELVKTVLLLPGVAGHLHAHAATLDGWLREEWQNLVRETPEPEPVSEPPVSEPAPEPPADSPAPSSPLAESARVLDQESSGPTMPSSVAPDAPAPLAGQDISLWIIQQGLHSFLQANLAAMMAKGASLSLLRSPAFLDVLVDTVMTRSDVAAQLRPYAATLNGWLRADWLALLDALTAPVSVSEAAPKPAPAPESVPPVLAPPTETLPPQPASVVAPPVEVVRVKEPVASAVVQVSFRPSESAQGDRSAPALKVAESPAVVPAPARRPPVAPALPVAPMPHPTVPIALSSQPLAQPSPLPAPTPAPVRVSVPAVASPRPIPSPAQRALEARHRTEAAEREQVNALITRLDETKEPAERRDITQWLNSEHVPTEVVWEESRALREGDERLARKLDACRGACVLLHKRMMADAARPELVTHEDELAALEARVMEVEADASSSRRQHMQFLKWLIAQTERSTKARQIAKAPPRRRSRALVAKADLPLLSDLQATRRGYVVGTTAALAHLSQRGLYTDIRTLHGWVKRGLLDAIKLQGEGRARLRFRLADLMAFQRPVVESVSVEQQRFLWALETAAQDGGG